MNNILKALQKEIDRCTGLIEIYNSIPTGALGAMFIKQAVDEGKDALVSGDVIDCLRCYQELESCQ